MPYDALTRGRRFAPGFAYLLTAVTAGRLQVFGNFDLARIVAREIHGLGKPGQCEVLAWVLMPDHLHVLIALVDTDLSDLVRALKGRSAALVNEARGIRGPLWQHGFHDHAVRREEDLRTLAEYVVGNPLRAGLVRSLRNYPFWNARWL